MRSREGTAERRWSTSSSGWPKRLSAPTLMTASDGKTASRNAAELELSFRILLDSSGETAATYGARTLPMSYIIDKDGSILARIIGIRSWDEPEFEQLFRTLAGREPVHG